MSIFSIKASNFPRIVSLKQRYMIVCTHSSSNQYYCLHPYYSLANRDKTIPNPDHPLLQENVSLLLILSFLSGIIVLDLLSLGSDYRLSLVSKRMRYTYEELSLYHNAHVMTSVLAAGNYDFVVGIGLLTVTHLTKIEQ